MDAYQRARAELGSTGTTMLQPSTAGLSVLRAMFGGLAVMAVIGFAILTITTGFPGVGAVLGLVPIVAMLGGLWVWMGRRAQTDRQAIVISATGLSVKGVGPVPWTHLMPPEVQWRQAEYDNAYRRLPVMPFTAAGFAYLQGNVPPHLRRQLCGRGTLWGAEPGVVRLPAVRGMGRNELMALLAQAHAHYSRMR